jgi:hypothetical protein
VEPSTGLVRFWGQVYSAYLSRLAILEPWGYGLERGSGPPLRNAPAPFGANETGLLLPHTDAADPGRTNSVAYNLRGNARLRSPLPDGTLLQVPAGFESWSDPQGLAGGPAWAIESQNILTELLGTPASTGGFLARPFFSSLGGWGYQRAQFAQNKTALTTDTSMGARVLL